MYRAYFAMNAGEPLVLDAQWYDDDNIPVDLWDIMGDLSWSIRSRSYWWIATVANGRLFVDADEGYIRMSMPSTDSINFRHDTYGRMALTIALESEEDDALIRGGVYIR